MTSPDYAQAVVDLLADYDALTPTDEADWQADRRSAYARRIVEAVVRDTAEMVMESQDQIIIEKISDAHVQGYQDGIRKGLEIAQQITGADLSGALAILAEVKA